MSNYELYVFILCLIVYILLTTLSVVCLTIIARLSLRLINSGVQDEEILKEYEDSKKTRPAAKAAKVIDRIVSITLCAVFVVLLIASLAIRCTENSYCNLLPTYRVVHTGSMSEANPKNEYLSENGLTDQFEAFDLIRTERLPDEMDLELYDIVVYEMDGMMIVHRIVEIEEPNEAHPDCRHFRLQGDAIEAADRFPVLYEQMRAIYRGERIPFIGSFVLFMQSPAGIMCVLLIVVAMFAAPWLDKKLQAAKNERIKVCLGIDPTQTTPDAR